jgi:dethiobiotin synthetase
MPGGARPRHLVVVAGTGTEVGKTWVSARLLERWRRLDLRTAARKPAQSFEPHSGPTDAEVLGQASGEEPRAVCPPERWYPVPLAPPMAARRLGREPLTRVALLAELRWPSEPVDVGLVETAGGLRSPLADDADNLDVAVAMEPDDVVLVADAGLGTISAVRLAAAALSVKALPTTVVLNRYDRADQLHVDNQHWLHDVDGLRVIAGDEAGIDQLAQQLAEPVLRAR